MKNPKQKLKNILLLFASLVLISCSEETHEHEETIHPSNIKREKVNFKKFSENKDAFAVYKNLKLTSSKTQSNSKAVSLDSLDFDVVFNSGLHLSYADLESYTFPIRRILPNGLLENLVINEHTDGKYYAKLLKYNLTNQEKSDLENENLKTITNPIQTEILGEVNFGNSIESDCGYETVQVITSCGSGEHHGGNIASWGSCTSSTLPSLKTITVAIDCVGNSGGGGGGDGSEGYYGNPFTGSGSGGGGGGYITPAFPNDLTPSEIYENGISEPVLDLDYQGKPLYLFYVNLTEQQKQWLNDQTPETQNSIADYLNLNDVSDESENIIKRWLDLQIALDSNPNLLLDIPCDQIPAWQNLTQFTPPQSVISKIEQLDAQSMFTDFEIQYLQGARGTVVNCDYFPVTINSFPTNPATGQPFTPTQFLNHVRKYINSFINTNYSSFSPSTVTGINESQIWNSSNGLGAILHIDIPFPGGDGSVICSQHNNSSWILTTIEVPYGSDQGEDGIHPVSGNREFGIFQNPNGSYTFYTRAVDRMTDSFESTFAENSTIFLNAFENPDLLWNSLTNKVSNYVQNNGGSAITPVATNNKIWRPNWYKVRQYLRGEVPLSALGCH